MKKKVLIISQIFLLVYIIYTSFFSDSARITKLIKKIDKTAKIEVLTDEETYIFDDFFDYFGYGTIENVKFPIAFITSPYEKKLKDINITVKLFDHNNREVGVAKTSLLQDSQEEVIFYMDYVYFSSHNDIRDLIKKQ